MQNFDQFDIYTVQAKINIETDFLVRLEEYKT